MNEKKKALNWADMAVAGSKALPAGPWKGSPRGLPREPLRPRETNTERLMLSVLKDHLWKQAIAGEVLQGLVAVVKVVLVQARPT